MATIEELFLATKPLLEKSIQEAVDAAMAKTYEEYLPHVENDTYFNVRQQATQWLMRYLSNSLLEDDIKLNFTSDSWDAVNIRHKIYEENKEEMQKLIKQDVLTRLQNLQEREAQHWERRY